MGILAPAFMKKQVCVYVLVPADLLRVFSSKSSYANVADFRVAYSATLQHVSRYLCVGVLGEAEF